MCERYTLICSESYPQICNGTLSRKCLVVRIVCEYVWRLGQKFCTGQIRLTVWAVVDRHRGCGLCISWVIMWTGQACSLMMGMWWERIHRLRIQIGLWRTIRRVSFVTNLLVSDLRAKIRTANSGLRSKVIRSSRWSLLSPSEEVLPFVLIHRCVIGTVLHPPFKCLSTSCLQVLELANAHHYFAHLYFAHRYLRKSAKVVLKSGKLLTIYPIILSRKVGRESCVIVVPRNTKGIIISLIHLRPWDVVECPIVDIKIPSTCKKRHSWAC